MNKRLVIILDPAHGEEVAGKRSPDGLHREYKWSRERLKELERKLKDNGYRVEYTNYTNNEIGLTARKNIASTLKVNSDQIKLMISLHNNAAGSNNEWMKARGIEIYTTTGKTKSDEFAKIVYNQLQNDFPELKFRGLKEYDFSVITGSGYYAMLIEWLFQDNYEDYKLLSDSDTNRKLINSLFNAIENINNKL